ncbi:MAG: zinc-ribbon domain containing protein [Vicinamibacterales bacterium]
MAEDQILTCVECRVEFVFSPGEQAFYAERGFTPPKRCSACREAKREREGARSVRAFDR